MRPSRLLPLTLLAAFLFLPLVSVRPVRAQMQALSVAPALAGDIIGPLSVSEIQLVTQHPVAASEFEPYTQNVSTTPVHLFSADLDAAVRKVTTAQNLRISNRHVSNGLCWRPIAFATSCAATCAGSGITCSGNSTDGDFIPPGQSLTVPILGNVCACVVASASSTTTTGSRITRTARAGG